MNAMTLGMELAKRRGEAGLTQAELAARMGTTQAAISRIESGRTLPSLVVLERLARATGREITLVLGGPAPIIGRRERRRRSRRALGAYTFNPWSRNPTPAEARSLLADGLTRERFQSPEASVSGSG